MDRNDVLGIERHLRRIAEALERISPPPPKTEEKPKKPRRGVVW